MLLSKLKCSLGEENKPFTNYSTLTKSLSREDYSRRKVNLLFDINITEKNSNNYFYSEHQQYLYNTIKELHEKGLGYRKISNWFNERNLKTPRGSKFKHNSVYSILKKGKIREERLNTESKWKIDKVKVLTEPVISSIKLITI